MESLNYKSENIGRKYLNNMKKNQFLKVKKKKKIFIELKEWELRPLKNTWYCSLINYIPETIRKSADGFKDKIVNLFKRNTSKQPEYETGK